MHDDFENIKHWVFDLDETLYSPEVSLFDEIKVLMVQYVQKELNISASAANDLRLHYWDKYGTTLAGLMAEHDLDPEPFLDYVHEIPLDALTPDPELSHHINSLCGEAIVYTNGTEYHARRVTAARGLAGCFTAYYGVEHANYIPKPKKAAFEMVFDKAQIEPKNGIIFEDDPRNLVEPHLMGMRTVLVGPYIDAPHIDYQTTDLTGFLGEISKAGINSATQNN
jgi:putative hydrolase of the HAD superfamily